MLEDVLVKLHEQGLFLSKIIDEQAIDHVVLDGSDGKGSVDRCWVLPGLCTPGFLRCQLAVRFQGDVRGNVAHINCRIDVLQDQTWLCSREVLHLKAVLQDIEAGLHAPAKPVQLPDFLHAEFVPWKRGGEHFLVPVSQPYAHEAQRHAASPCHGLAVGRAGMVGDALGRERNLHVAIVACHAAPLLQEVGRPQSHNEGDPLPGQPEEQRRGAIAAIHDGKKGAVPDAIPDTRQLLARCGSLVEAGAKGISLHDHAVQDIVDAGKSQRGLRLAAFPAGRPVGFKVLLRAGDQHVRSVHRKDEAAMKRVPDAVGVEVAVVVADEKAEGVGMEQHAPLEVSRLGQVLPRMEMCHEVPQFQGERTPFSAENRVDQAGQREFALPAEGSGIFPTADCSKGASGHMRHVSGEPVECIVDCPKHLCHLHPTRFSQPML